MDFNAKPTQGAVFWVIRGHVMGVPADYNDKSFATRCIFRPPNWVPEPVSMLPIPKDWIASHECVVGNVKGPGLATARPNTKVKIAADVEVRVALAKQNQGAPIKVVNGCAWSPRIYWDLRLLGKSLHVAWKRAFICSLTFN